jgi:hypothetical protein
MEHAFTDRMVREDKEDLTEAVLKYLQTYKGNFQPILDARRAVHEGYALNVAEIRMVLNVMRADTSIRLEYAPPEGNVIQFPRAVAFEEEEEARPRKPEYREFLVRGRIKSKFIFGISTHKTAVNVHYINHSRTRFIYKQAGARSHSRQMGWHQLWENRIEIEYFWECSSKNPKVRLLTSAECFRLVEEGLMKLCPTCLTLRTKESNA